MADIKGKAAAVFPMLAPVVLFHAFVHNTGELTEATKLAFLMGSIFQLLAAAALFGGAVFIYSRKLNPKTTEESGRKPFWRVVTYVLILVGIILTVGAILSFASYLAAPEIAGGSALT